MRRVVLLCAAIAFAIACGDNITEPIPDRTQRTAPVSFATSTSDDGLSITTDKDDYAPGDTVHFTGTGWQAGDVLDIVLVDDAVTQETHTWTVSVGEDGTFHDSTYVVDTDDIGVTFTLTATSQATGRALTVVFTDGNFKYTTAPANLVASITLTQRAGTTCPGGMNQGTVTASYNTNVALNTSLHYVFSVPAVSGYTYVGYTSANNNISVSPASDPSNNMLCVVSVANQGGSIELDYLDNTTTTLSHSPAATNVGQQVTFTATVKDHNGDPIGNKGSATFYEFTGVQTCDALGSATALAGPVNLTNNPSGQASFQKSNLTAGTHVITACYGGTSAYTKSFGSVTHVVANPDNQAPTISCTAPNPTLWYASDVTVPCTASDASGLANAGDASFSLSTSVPANAETPTAGTGTRQVCDILNNCATAGPFSFKVDKKAPVVSCGAADAVWHGSDVSIVCTATDGGSGLANALDASFNLTTSVSPGTETTNALTDSKNVLDVVGNSATAGPVGNNKVDKKAPTIACGAADGSWHDADVSIHCTASDAGSGLKNAADASFNLVTNVAANTETANAQTDSRNVLDNVSNSATAGPIGGNQVDKKAPEIACAAADGIWHAADVSIHCTATDGGSGLANSADASFNLVTNVAANTEISNASTDSRSVLDEVGHSATAGPIAGNMIDKKAPVVSCGAADGAWHASNVSIACTASDGGSGVSPSGDATFSLSTSVAAGTETNNASTNSKEVADAVGNSTTAGPIAGNKVDKKDPTVACGVADGAWHASDVSIACTASDGGSGLANAGDASFSLSTSVAAGTETNNASTNSNNVADAVGNSATAGPISGNKVDKKGPVVTLTCPLLPVILGAPANAGWTATDGGSGVAPGFASGNIPLVTSSVGAKTATAPVGTSKDNVNNNSAPQVTCGYSVAYNFAGLAAPVDRPNTFNLSKAGQAIPLKWRLTDYNGNGVVTLTAVTVKVGDQSCSLGTSSDQIEEYAPGASGLQNLGDGYYQFNWKSPTSYASSCKSLALDLGEGTPRSNLAYFTFKQ